MLHALVPQDAEAAGLLALMLLTDARRTARTGPDGELIPLDIAVGDTVFYSKYGGTEITVGGEDLLILAGRDVLAKVEK